MEQSFLVSDTQLMHQHWNKHQGCKIEPNQQILTWSCLHDQDCYHDDDMLTTYKNPPIHKFSREDQQLWWSSSWITTQTWRQLFFLFTGEICQKLRLKLKIWKFSPGLVSRGFQGQKSENNNNNNNNKSRRITMFWFSVLRQEYKRMIKYLYLISGW